MKLKSLVLPSLIHEKFCECSGISKAAEGCLWDNLDQIKSSSDLKDFNSALQKAKAVTTSYELANMDLQYEQYSYRFSPEVIEKVQSLFPGKSLAKAITDVFITAYFQPSEHEYVIKHLVSTLSEYLSKH